MWNTLKKQIDRGALYSSKWFEKANLEELETASRLVQQDYTNPNLDLDYRDYCWNLLKRFDNAIEEIKWAGKEYGYPVHSSNGWHLTSDDKDNFQFADFILCPLKSAHFYSGAFSVCAFRVPVFQTRVSPCVALRLSCKGKTA